MGLRTAGSSLRVKLVLSSVIIELVMLCLLLANSVRLINQATHEHAETHLEEIPPLLDNALAPLLFQQDYAAINEFLDDLILDQDRGISYIIIYDTDGHIHGQKGNVNPGALPQPVMEIGDTITEEVIHSEIALTLSGIRVGMAKFGISLAHLIRSKEKLLRQGILIAAAEILLTILLLSLVGYMLTKHITALLEGARQVSRGDYDIRIPSGGTGEVRELAVSFNQMAAAVRQQTRDLKESQEKYKKLFERESDAVLIYHPGTTRILEVNPATSRIYGYSHDELKGMSHTELRADAGRAEAFAEVPCRLHRRKDGTVFPVDHNEYPITLGGETLMYTVARDITRRVQAEKNLRESEKRFRDFVENTDNLITRVDTHGNFIYVNHMSEQIFGVPAHQCMGLSAFSFIHEKDLQRTREWFEGCVRERVRSAYIENQQVSRHGRVSDMIWTVNFHYDAHGRITHINSIARDITEQKKLEARLQQAQKMEAIGTLAGGIAHDFNNILSPLLGYTEMLQDDISDDSPLQEDITQIFNATLRAKELVRQILTFSRQSKQETRPVHLQHILKEVLKLIGSSFPSTINIRTRIAPEECLVMADPTQLHQIVMNLTTNAYHAMRESGGTLEVGLSQVTVDSVPLGLTDLAPGEYALLNVTDSGKGIEKGIMDRIFDPYFTTKKEGEGTGLGLSVVRGILQNHSGDIHIYSEVNKGTQVHVYLPLVNDSGERPSRETLVPVPTGSGKILIVDDEAAIARMEKDMLERLGYTVTAFTDSMEAHTRFASDPNGFDLVISDMTMPGFTGLDLAKRMRAIRPDIPFIICSGFSDQINETRIRELNIQGYLAKPVIKSDIATLIRTVLADRSH